MEILISIIPTISFLLIANNIRLLESSLKKLALNFLILSSTTICVVNVLELQKGLFAVIIVLIIIAILQNRQEKISVIILKGIIVITIFLISDTMVGLINLYVFKISFETIRSNPDILVVNNIFCTLIGYLISFVGVHIQKRTKGLVDDRGKEEKISNDILRLLFINIGIIVALFIILYYIITGNNLAKTELLMIYAVFNLVYLVFAILSGSMIIKIFTKNIKVMKKENELKNLVEYNTSLESMYSELRQFRHDYLNILSTLSGYIEEKDIEGLEHYFNNNIIKYTERISNNNHRIACLRNLKINSIKGLVFSKMIKAQEIGIDVDIEILSDIDKIGMEEIDLARCLGIVIDNAIDGAKESSTNNLKLAFISVNDSVIIIVVNSIREGLPPLYKLVEKGYSTKGDNRGLGLYNLKEIVSQYPNVNMDINITENEFLVAIECKN